MTDWDIASPSLERPSPRTVPAPSCGHPSSLLGIWPRWAFLPPGAGGGVDSRLVAFSPLTAAYRNSSLRYTRTTPGVWRASALNRERFCLLRRLRRLAETYWASWSPPSRSRLTSDRLMSSREPDRASRQGEAWGWLWSRSQSRLMGRPPGSLWAVSGHFWYSSCTAVCEHLRGRSRFYVFISEKNVSASEFASVWHSVLQERALRVPGSLWFFLYLKFK